MLLNASWTCCECLSLQITAQEACAQVDALTVASTHTASAGPSVPVPNATTSPAPAPKGAPAGRAASAAAQPQQHVAEASVADAVPAALRVDSLCAVLQVCEQGLAAGRLAGIFDDFMCREVWEVMPA